MTTLSNPLKKYMGRAGQLRYKVAPWMLDRQVAHIPVGLAISWLVFLWPLDVAASALWGARLTAVLLFAGFILYEVTEDQEINDQAYRDIGHTGVRDRSGSRGSGSGLVGSFLEVAQVFPRCIA